MTDAPRAEVLIRAASIETFDDSVGRVRSLAIAGGRVVAVGRGRDELDGLSGPDTRVIDDGALHVIPAFFDTHVHQYEGGLNLLTVQVDGIRTISDLVDRMRVAATASPSGSWIVSAKNWHESTLRERRLPVANELDQASPDHSVYVRRGSHTAVVNTNGLRLAGITRDTPDPPGGTIGRDGHGEPNGQLLGDPALDLVAGLLPPVTFEQRVEGLEKACRLFNSRGIGSVREPGIATEDFRVYQRLWEERRLTVRSQVMVRLNEGWPTGRMLGEIARWGLQTGFGDDLFRIGGVKLFVDGRIEDAALRDPYATDPGWRGRLHLDRSAIVQVASAAVGVGWDVGCHTVGDAAMDEVLGAYEQILRDHPGLDARRLVIEHALLATPEQLRKAAALGIGLSIHPPLLYAFGSDILRCWGEPRANSALALRDWVKSRALVAAGSDGCVPPFDPLLAIWTMVTRGTASAGVLGPDQALDRRTAFELYTVAGARLFRRSEERGTLTPGQAADLTAFCEDPLSCPADQIPSLSPVMTVVGGRPVFDPEGRALVQA